MSAVSLFLWMVPQIFVAYCCLEQCCKRKKYLPEVTQIYCRLSGILWPYWTSNHMTYNCNFKYTIDWNTLTKIELYTKITFWVSIIPKLCLFFILAILIDVHIRFQVMWPLSSFLSASVCRSYSKTWNHTPRSPSWVQWYCFQCWLFWVAAILNFGSRNF